MDIIPTFDRLIQYQHKHVHVVGVAGTEGFAILQFLLKHGFTNITAHNLSDGNTMKQAFLNAHVAMSSPKRLNAFENLLNAPAMLCTGPDYLKGIDTADLIFATQNWFSHAANRPVADARNNGVPLLFLTQLYFALSPAPVIGVTGTNGKTTVTSCVAHLLKTAGIPYLISGNDRYQEQVLDRLDSLPPNGFLVLEISNRQLLELNQGPYIGVLTNIRPDHIDEHGSYEAYRNVKMSLFANVPPDGWAVLNIDDASFHDILPRLEAHYAGYGCGKPDKPLFSGLHNGEFVVQDYTGANHVLFEKSDVHLPGQHNLLNSLAAATTAFIAGVSAENIRSGIRSFSGVRHRIERLDEINGVVFYDDEASTNPLATGAAVAAMNRPTVLIVGGDIKGNADDYKEPAPVIKQFVRHIIRLPGDAGHHLTRYVSSVPVHDAADLIEAMQIADRLLRPGQALLLSPSGAGFHTRFNIGYKGFRRLVRDRRRRANGIDRNSCSPEFLS